MAKRQEEALAKKKREALAKKDRKKLWPTDKRQGRDKKNMSMIFFLLIYLSRNALFTVTKEKVFVSKLKNALV